MADYRYTECGLDNVVISGMDVPGYHYDRFVVLVVKMAHRQSHLVRRSPRNREWILEWRHSNTPGQYVIHPRKNSDRGSALLLIINRSHYISIAPLERRINHETI